VSALARQADLFSNTETSGNQKTMANLSDILSRPATEFNFPPPLPIGGYHCVVAGLPEQVVSSIKKTDGFEFTLKPIGTDEDVDQEELSKLGGLEEKTIKHTMWISQNPAKVDTTVAMLREFLEHCGIDPENKSVNEMIDLCPNTEVMVYLKHTPLQGREGFRAEVAKTGPVVSD
jgi:hypothetical protein